MGLDCCFERTPGTCSRHPGCAAKDLEGECCPATNGENLDCCYEDGNGFPIIDAEYCKAEQDFSCYKFGVPECCLTTSIACPKEQPECEVGFPIIGDSYCTYAPKYGCYLNGWPECCEENPKNCPVHRPNCELGNLFKTDGDCSKSPDFRCYELGFPDCCLTENESCPNERQECNVGKVGCGLYGSLPSLFDFACSQRNFDILCYLIQKSDLEQLLQSDGPYGYTLFAPSNDAFQELGDDMVVDLLEDPTGELQGILKYHISETILFESDLECGRKIDTLRGYDSIDDFTTTTCGLESIYQMGNGNDNNDCPEIVATDIVTCNGVVHVVDKVILPTA